MPAISVIIPTRRRHHLLPRALESLFAQTFRDFEILLVDDNPAGERVAQQSALQPLLRDPRVRLIEHDAPRNAATARNCALKAAAGDFITYLDDDDAFRPAKLERQWQRARDTGVPIGFCGAVYHLGGRQRVRIEQRPFIAGPELLLSFQALPTLFHANPRGVLFDESLDAGEDGHYFFRLIEHFKADRVFNVPEALVDIYPQPGPRVNLNADGHWAAAQAVYRDFAPRYGERTAAVYWARARLGRAKCQRGVTADMCRAACELLRLRGLKDVRLISNCFLFKVPFLRRFLVS